MSDISDDIMKAAQEICAPSYSGAVRVDDAQHVLDVARALLAEREAATIRERKRCANWCGRQASALFKLNREPEKRAAFAEAHNTILKGEV